MRQRSSYGWLELIVGILLTVLGIYSFFRPVDYLTTLIVIYGVAALVTGIADIVFYCKMERHHRLCSDGITRHGRSRRNGRSGSHGPSGRRALGNRAVLPALVHRTLHFPAHAPVCRALHRGYGGLRVRADVNILGILLGVSMLLTPQVTFLSMNLVIGFYLLLLGIDCIIEACSKLGAR